MFYKIFVQHRTHPGPCSTPPPPPRPLLHAVMAVWQTKVSSLYCPGNSAPIKTLFLVIKAQTGLYLVPWFTLQHTISTIMSPFLPIFSAVWGLKRSRLSFCWTDSEVFSVVYPAEFCFCLSALLYVEVVVTFSLKFHGMIMHWIVKTISFHGKCSRWEQILYPWKTAVKPCFTVSRCLWFSCQFYVE